MTDYTHHFRHAMRQAGLDYAGPILADGRLHHFKAEGDKTRNSWYVLYAGPPMAGAFGCWKRGIKESWCEKRRDSFTDGEWRTIRTRWEQTYRERERAEVERQARARRVAARILKRSKPADP